MLILATLGLTTYMLCLLMSDEEETSARLAYYRGLATLCQNAARRIGETGIAAELEYHKILETGRMI